MNTTSTTGTNLCAPRALIADDQPDVLAALRLLLKGEGYQTEAVNSPSAVLEALSQRDFDLLLMDLNYARDTTSGQEGLDLLTHIQDVDSTLPIVVMTAWGSIELAVEAMRRGVRDFIQKPWDNARLLGILRAQIEHGKAERKRIRLERIKKSLEEEALKAADLQTMLDTAAERLRQALRISSAVVFIKALRDHAFWAGAKAGVADEIVGRLKFDPDSRLISLMDSIFDAGIVDVPEDEWLKLRKAQGRLIVPIRRKGELIGFIVLGEKSSGEGYDEDERKFLASVVDAIGMSVYDLLLRGQEQEYEEAREIQQGLLPKEIQQIDGYRISDAWRPAQAVSGDYFDVLKFNENRIGLCIADVVGKGMPAALLMSNVQAAVKAFASESALPQELCGKVNRVMCGNIGANKFITFFYCLIDAKRKRLLYANAGHNAPILVRSDGSSLRLKEGGAVLGVFPKGFYEQGEVGLASGDRVLLFTDGVTEARNSDDEEFGEERLVELLAENRRLGAEDLQRTVMDAVADFSGGKFHDDATLIVLAVE